MLYCSKIKSSFIRSSRYKLLLSCRLGIIRFLTRLNRVLASSLQFIFISNSFFWCFILARLNDFVLLDKIWLTKVIDYVLISNSFSRLSITARLDDFVLLNKVSFRLTRKGSYFITKFSNCFYNIVNSHGITYNGVYEVINSRGIARNSVYKVDSSFYYLILLLILIYFIIVPNNRVIVKIVSFVGVRNFIINVYLVYLT